MLTPGQRIVVRIEKAVVGGDMLARHDGQVVFVSGTLPGEVVEIRIDRVARGYARGTTIEVREPDPARREFAGDASCGGATYGHIVYARQLRLKHDILADAFQRVGGRTLDEPIEIAASAERGYRMRARFRVRAGRLGFVKAGSHDICDPATTGQLLPETERAVEALQSWMAEGWRGVEAVEFAENVAADARVAHIEARGRPPRVETGVLERAGYSGITWGHGRASTLFGSPSVSDRVETLVGGAGLRADVSVRRRATSFFQGNRYLVGALANAVRRHTECDRVLDLYAGVGLHALTHLADGRPRVTAVEGDRRTARDLLANIRALGGGLEVRHLSVEAFLRRTAPEPAAAAIVNPTRSGLSRDALLGLQRLTPARIVYVSCDVATLARDVRRLEGHYALRHLEGYDMFPNTAHVEVVAVLVRRNG